MKRIIVPLLMSLMTNVTFAQNWLILNYPEANILGREVLKYDKGDIDYVPGRHGIANPKIDVNESADELTEYNEKFRSFITKYFRNSKYSVTEVKAKNLQIKRVNVQSVEEMQPRSKYIYSGLAADSVEITIRSKVSGETNYGKILQDVGNLITQSNTSTVVAKVLPLFDSISSQKGDSINYRVLLANPNVYYKIKIVKLKRKLNHDWDSKWLYFDDEKEDTTSQKSTRNEGIFNESFLIKWDPGEKMNYSEERYPRFYGKDDASVKFRLKASKIDEDLRLFVSYKTGGRNTDMWKDVEVPFKIVGGKKHWVMDPKLIYDFDFKGITKLVYIQVRADQVDENTVQVFNKNERGDPITWMKYPEIKFSYVSN